MSSYEPVCLFAFFEPKLFGTEGWLGICNFVCKKPWACNESHESPEKGTCPEEGYLEKEEG